MPFNRLNHHVLGDIRPRFRLSSSLNKEALFSKIQEHLDQDATVKGAVVKEYAILKIPQEEAHYWSPELQVRVEVDEFELPSEDTTLRCLIGPKQSVWSLFVFFYSAIGAITFFGGSYGLIQMNMGKSSPFVWLIPVGLILIPSIWLVAKIGQKTGRDQMLHLVSFLYHALEQHGEVKRVE